MSRYHAIWASPLCRHPALLLRKIRARLNGNPRIPPSPAAPQLTYSSPTSWRSLLETWLAHLPASKNPAPFNRVFGQDFPEEMLLQQSGQGPCGGPPGLAADIKLGWEFSRAYPLFLLALKAPGETSSSVNFLRRWLRFNQYVHAVSRDCPMEVAIRMVNWVLADSLHNGTLSSELGLEIWKEEVWCAGDFLWKNLEARWFPSNHYLANLLGLWVIGSVFPLDKTAQHWRRFTEREFPRALQNQTRKDGGLCEASLRYHAYVTEMALLFRFLYARSFPAKAEARLIQMCQVVSDFRDASGNLFPFGDDDGGRILNLDGDSGLSRIDILLGLAWQIWRHGFTKSSFALYPDSGWWVRRQNGFTVALDFGGVGLWGRGAHAHNDQLSCCMEWRDMPVLVDPGTYLYTGDPAARQRFRSAQGHNAPQLGDQEPLSLPAELFLLPGPDQPGPVFQPQSVSPIFQNHARTITRQIEFHSESVSIRDKWRAQKNTPIRWAFYFHPDVTLRQDVLGWILEVPQAGLLRFFSPQGISIRAMACLFSPSYGQAVPCHKLVAENPPKSFGEVRWEFRVEKIFP